MNIIQFIPIQVLLPLIFSLMISIIKNYKASSILTILVFIFSFGISLLMLYETHNISSGISYYMGGWKPPFGIELKISFITELIVSLISFIGLANSIYTFYALPFEINQKKHYLINVCILLNFTGMIGMLITNDIFNIYVFLEISSLSSYGLICASNKKSSLILAFEYLMIGTIGATFYLIGIGFVYSVSGTLNVSDLNVKILHLINNKVFVIGTSFIMIGLMIKSALFPLCNWMIKAYSCAPTFVSTFMSGTATKVSMYLIIKYIYLIFGAQFILKEMLFQEFLTILSLMAIIYGSYFAVKQTSFRMILSYSSVAQIGYIILGIALNSVDGLSFSIMQMIVHSITKVPLFMIAGICYIVNNSDEMQYLNISNNSGIKMSYLLLASSMFGLPITAGFITKWYLLSAIIKNIDSLIFQYAFFFVVISSIFPLFYLRKIWNGINCNLSVKDVLSVKTHVPFYIIFLLFVLIAINLSIGVYPKILSEVIYKNISFFFEN